jgi:hypothetical protein
MARREYPLTAAYAKFVNAGLIAHTGKGGKKADLPDGIKNASQDLTPNQTKTIKGALNDIVDRLMADEPPSEILDVVPEYQGTNEDAKNFLQEVLELAEKAEIPDANMALRGKSVVFVLIISCAKTVQT